MDIIAKSYCAPPMMSASQVCFLSVLLEMGLSIFFCTLLCKGTVCDEGLGASDYENRTTLQCKQTK